MSEGKVQDPQQQFMAYIVKQESGSESNGEHGENHSFLLGNAIDE